MIDLTVLAGVSALVAAVATVVGAIFLGLFFSKGQPWGTLNDLASIILMVAMLPVALFFADLTSARVASPVALAVAAVGIVGMLGVTVAQGLLVAGIRTYRQLLPWTLGFGAVVGAWYLGVGITAAGAGVPGLLAVLAVLAGLSYMALGYGFWRGDERHPLSILGGVVMLVASTAFLVWTGISTLAGAALNA